MKCGEIAVYFDVDGTLVRPFRGDHSPWGTMAALPHFEFNPRMVEEINTAKARGHTVVVWSAGGAKWAEQVVDALNLRPQVDFILTKPNWYYDDQDASDFMRRIYV